MRVSKEFKLGLLVIIGAVTIFVGLNILKSGSFFKTSNEYYAVFDDATGLKVGNEVQLSGVKIGEVVEVGLHPLNPSYVLAKFNIANEDLKISKSSEAWLVSVDVISTKCIELRLDLSDTASTELLADGDTLKSKVKISMDQEFMKQFEPIKNKTEVLINRVQNIIVEVNELWDSSASYTFEESVYEARNAIGTYKQLANNLVALINGETKRIVGIKNNVAMIRDSILNKMNTITVISSNIGSINGNISSTDLVAEIAILNVTMTDLNSLVVRIKNGEGSLGALTKTPDFQSALKDTKLSLDSLMENFMADPMNYVGLSILGKKIEGVILTKQEEKKLKEWLSR